MMKTSIAISACLTFAVTVAATAAPTQSLQTTEVRYHAAELNNPVQAKELYRRIKFAARTVCPQYAVPDLERVLIQRTCIDTAIDNAVESVAHPSLTALHDGATRVHLATR